MGGRRAFAAMSFALSSGLLGHQRALGGGVEDGGGGVLAQRSGRRGQHRRGGNGGKEAHWMASR